MIPLYSNNSEVRNIHGITIGNADNTYRITELSTKNIYSEQTTKDLKLVKFTLPDLQPGCIIEYSYELITPNIFNFKTWYFQADIPKLHSLFNPVIPANFKYNISLRGYLPLATNASRLLKEKFQYNNLRYDCTDLYFAMDSVPAFVEEDFMTSADNFRAAVYFELSEQVLKSGNSEYYTKSWKYEDEYLQRHKDFGLQLKNDRLLKKTIPLILPADTSALARAKAITAYIKKQIKWNKQFDIFTTGNITDALEKHTGNTADINFSLIAALNLAGIPTDIAILSTRDNIVPNKLYPVITNFNDVVALAHINGREYWLDATDPDLGFGQLPLQCLNDSARIIPRDGPSYWKLIAPNQMLKETYTFKGKLNPNGRLEGYLTIKSDSYTASIKRKMIAACNSVDEYADKKADANPGITWKD